MQSGSDAPPGREAGGRPPRPGRAAVPRAVGRPGGALREGSERQALRWRLPPYPVLGRVLFTHSFIQLLLFWNRCNLSTYLFIPANQP